MQVLVIIDDAQVLLVLRIDFKCDYFTSLKNIESLDLYSTRIAFIYLYFHDFVIVVLKYCTKEAVRMEAAPDYISWE